MVLESYACWFTLDSVEVVNLWYNRSQVARKNRIKMYCSKSRVLETGPPEMTIGARHK